VNILQLLSKHRLKRNKHTKCSTWCSVALCNFIMQDTQKLRTRDCDLSHLYCENTKHSLQDTHEKVLFHNSLVTNRITGSMDNLPCVVCSVLSQAADDVSVWLQLRKSLAQFSITTLLCAVQNLQDLFSTSC
jgi:hypothetical protein